MDIKIEDRRFTDDVEGKEISLVEFVEDNREDQELVYFLMDLMELEVGNSWQYGPHYPKFTRTK